MSPLKLNNDLYIYICKNIISKIIHKVVDYIILFLYKPKKARNKTLIVRKNVPENFQLTGKYTGYKFSRNRINSLLTIEMEPFSTIKTQRTERDGPEH